MSRGPNLEGATLKVLRAVAELEDVPVNVLMERIVLDSFEGKSPFSTEALQTIEKLKAIYGLTRKEMQGRTGPKKNPPNE